MRQISYSDEHFVTSDTIAARLLKYAMLMGRMDTDDVVGMPAVADDGTIYQVDVLIGPASQITSVEVKGDETEFPNEAEVVAELEKRITSLVSRRAAVAEAPVESGTALDPDYL